MEEIRASEAKEHLDDLLDRVEKGEEITITRGGKPVARLVRETELAVDPSAAIHAMERIKLRRRGVTLGPDLTIRDLIDEGHR